VSHKLLLADDSITIQKVVELILADEDFEIKSAGNGEEALALVSSFEPDVVLADIEMPKMNGYQLCDRLKQNPSTSSVPVILLTGAFEPIDEELAKQVKADDFIVKPFESQELISKINAVLTIMSVAEADLSEESAVVAEALGIEDEAVSAIEESSFEQAGIEEDLWTMEEDAGAQKLEAWPAEEAPTAEAEEFAELAEETFAEIAEPAEEVRTKPAEKARPTEMKADFSGVVLPSRDDFREYFKGVVDEKMSALVSSLDIKEAVLAALMPLMKDAVEKILWEVAPDLTERMLREMLKGSLESLSKEVEKVIWETVPDLAETMISKEIERIRSEF